MLDEARREAVEILRDEFDLVVGTDRLDNLPEELYQEVLDRIGDVLEECGLEDEDLEEFLESLGD